MDLHQSRQLKIEDLSANKDEISIFEELSDEELSLVMGGANKTLVDSYDLDACVAIMGVELCRNIIQVNVLADANNNVAA